MRELKRPASERIALDRGAQGETTPKKTVWFPAWAADRRPDRFTLLLAAAGALGAGLVLLRVAGYGPLMWYDAVLYITAARNLLAGDGLVGLGGGPWVYWPPLYPALLAGGGLFGLDPYAVAGPLNAVFFGLTVLAAGWWLRRHLHSRFLWLWGCFSIALALPLAEMASQALSESAFILFVTLSLTQTAVHLDGGGRASLIRAAAFSAAACLTRYMGASVILAVVPLLLVVLHGREIPFWNAGARQGYGAPRWRNSESVRYIREAALTGAVLSNVHLAPILHADDPARRYELLCEPDRLRGALSNAPGGGEAHVLYFSDWGYWRPCPRQQDDDLRSVLSRDPWLELVAELADGKLYRLIEPEFRPVATFHTADAPVVGKWFGAVLNESRGRRLPGEPWRWEKGGDADGWTSLPVQQSTDWYAPTVADVGHRLRASMHYADHLGNRVKAMTKPSQPVQPDILKVLAPLTSEDGKGAAGASEAYRIITSKYAVYLYGNRLFYGNRSCIWEDEYGTRFPLIVYLLDSESGKPERDILDFEWRTNFWKDNGICVIERRLPHNDIIGIRTGQVDRDGNLLWENEHWFKEKRLWFDSYWSSATSGEPVIRSDFDIYINENTLTYVKAPCAPADTEAMFFLALYPADVNDLPDRRKQHGFDNLDFDFDGRGMVLDGRCMVRIPLPEYDIARIGTGQYVVLGGGGFHHFWETEFSWKEGN